MAEKKAASKPKMLGTNDVAKKLGIAPATLRRILRAEGKNTVGEYSRYQWKPEELTGDKLDKLKKMVADHTADGKKEGVSKKKASKKKAAKKASKKTPPADTVDNDEGDIEEEEEEIA